MRKLLLLCILLLPTLVSAQQTTFSPTCAGSNDTSRFSAIITAMGSNKGAIRLPYKSGTRCAVNNLTIPANVTLDNSDGTGVKVNTGQTLTIVGPVVSTAKLFFSNATAGLGTISFAGNKVVMAVHPEWWGGGVEIAAATNSAALNAANVALTTNGVGGNILLGNGLYSINAALTIGTDSAFTTVSIVGKGTLLSGLNWTGATNVTVIRDTRGRNNNHRDFFLQNCSSSPCESSARGTTIGMLLTGPGSGTQSIGANPERIAIRGFNYGLQLGEAGNHAASEFKASACLFERNNRGVYVAAQNSTNIKLDHCQYNSNVEYGVYDLFGNILVSGGSVVDTGAGAAGIADFYVANFGDYLTIDGVRSELNAGTMFVKSGASQNDAVINVRGCAVKAVGSFTTPLFGGRGTWRITGNSFFSDDKITLIFGDDPAVSPIVTNAGNATSVTLTDNTTYEGATVISISALYSGIDGLRYTLNNNQKVTSLGGAAGFWQNEPDGRVVWPGKLSGEHLLQYNSAVNLNTATASTLFTNNTGRTVVITKVVLSNASTSLTTASISFGWTSAAYNDVIATATHTELTTAALQTILFPKIGAKLGPSAGSFKVLANILQGGAATCDIAVYGYYAS